MKRIIKVEPGPNGVGQTVTFDDGSTEFDAYGTAQVDPAVSADAAPAPEVPPPRVGTTEIVDLNGPAPEPVTDPMTGMPIRDTPPATPEQQAASRRTLADPVKAIMQPAPAAKSIVPLEPGAADAQPPAPEAPPPIAQVVVPGQAGGFQPTAMQRTGIAPEAAQGMRDTAIQGGAALISGAEEQAQAQEQYISGLETTALNRYLKAEAEALAIAADQKRQELVNQAIQAKLKDTAAFKPDRHQLFEGTAGGFRALLSGLGMIAGGMLSGLQGGPNHALEAVFKMIDDNVQDQVAQNSGVYNELVRRLGDEQAAAAALKQKHLQATAEMASALELTAKTKEMRAGLAGARQRAEFEAANYALKVQQLLAPQETLNMAYRAPTPASVMTIDMTQQQLKQLGVADDQVKDFVGAKIAGKEGKTVGEALQYMKELQQDMATLKGIAAANGGQLPGVDQVLSPAQSPTMRAALARLGIDHELQAAEVYKIVNSVVTKRAKAYGGAITEADKASAASEVGVTSGQVLDFMHRMYNEANGQVKAVATGYFLGRAQPVLDILTHSIGTMQGLRQDAGRPRIPQ